MKHLSWLSYRDVFDEFHITSSQQPKPHNMTIKWCCDRFHSTRCVTYHRKGTHYEVSESLNETVVLASVHNDPRHSTNTIAKETGLWQSTMWRKFKRLSFSHLRSIQAKNSNQGTGSAGQNLRGQRLKFWKKILLSFVIFFSRMNRPSLFTITQTGIMCDNRRRQTSMSLWLLIPSNRRKLMYHWCTYAWSCSDRWTFNT